MKKRFVVSRNTAFWTGTGCRAREIRLQKFDDLLAATTTEGEAEEVTMKGRGGRAERAGRPATGIA